MPIEMFLRVKKRINASGKMYEYAYQVVNKYRKRRKMPKQKVKQYLGRVYRFEKRKNQVIETIETEKTTIKKNMILLLENELKNYGFQEKEGCWQQQLYMINLEQNICMDQQGRNCCIAINDGLLHTTTIRALTTFKPKEGLEKEIGEQLGKALISAGIRPKEAVFINLFRQIMRQLNNEQQYQTMTGNNEQQ